MYQLATMVAVKTVCFASEAIQTEQSTGVLGAVVGPRPMTLGERLLGRVRIHLDPGLLTACDNYGQMALLFTTNRPTGTYKL